MANPGNGGAVIIDVEARLSSLDRSLAEGDRRIRRFASDVERQSARIDQALTGHAAADKLIGDVRALRAQANEVQQAAARVEDASEQTGGSLGRTAARAAAAGAAAYLLSQNLQELGGQYARAGSAIQDLMQLNIVGFFKNVTAETESSAAELLKVNDAGKLAELGFAAAAAGADKLARNAYAAAAALAAANAEAAVSASIGAASARTGLTGTAADAAQFGERSDRFGRGPGSVAEQNSRAGGATVDPLVGLSQRLKTALAAADASPGTKDDVAQIKRALESLEKQLGQKGLNDKDREDIYGTISTLNSRLEALAEPAADPLVGLSQRLRTALAAAFASPGTSDDVAQVKRAIASLEKQLRGRNVTDKDREGIYNALADLNAKLETLKDAGKAAGSGQTQPVVPVGLEIALEQALQTKGIRDDLARLKAIDDYLTAKIKVEADQNRKLEQLRRQGQVRSQIAALASSEKSALTVVSDLFSGDFLGSAEFQRAQSFGYKPRGADLLADLKSQVKEANQLATDLAVIRKRGGSAGLVESLAGQDPGLVHALAGSSQSVFRQYGQLFGRRADQAEGMSKLADTVNIIVNTKTEAEGIKKGLRQAGFAYTRGK